MLQSSVCYRQSPGGTLTASQHSLCSPLANFISSLLPSSTTRRSVPCLISCSAFERRGIGESYRRRPAASIKWKDIYDRVTLLENSETGASALLNQCEIEGKIFEKSELYIFVRNLRKFRRYKLALEVCEWICNRPDRFGSEDSSDMAIRLDLIARVHGVQSAEDFFTRIPDSQRDKRVYGALLHAYVEAKEKDRAKMLMETMRTKRCLTFPLSFNNMLTLYMKLKEYYNVELVISEMKRSKIRLDGFSYNIWISARGSQGSVAGIEEIFKEMEKDPNVTPNWSTFTSMATWYIKLGEPEMAKDCLKSLETLINRQESQDRSPYHFLLNLCARLGDKEEIYRFWGVYKSRFETMTNWGYHSVIHSLVLVGDIQEAEKIYNEWFLAKSAYDPRISNILLRWYVSVRNSEMVESFFTHMVKDGGKLFPSTWEIMAEHHIQGGRVLDALAAFGQAKSVGPFKPKPVNVSAFIELCEEEGDEVSRKGMVELIRELGLSEDEYFRGWIEQRDEGEGGGESRQVNLGYAADHGDGIGWSENEGSELMLSAI